MDFHAFIARDRARAAAPAPLDRTRLRPARFACRDCGAHVTVLVGRATIGGACGNCGGSALAPAPGVRARPGS